ncbi:MAG: hypothetical protein AAGA35_00005 [Patescibacteria group bacterium]
MTAMIPTKLPAGSYIAEYTIFNDEEVEQTGQVNLSILPYGTLQKAGYGFFGLSVSHKISILLPVLSLIIVILYLVYLRTNRRRHVS